MQDADEIPEDARYECQSCWTPYDPELGDPVRDVLPGTPFAVLPADWRCPVCGADRAQFQLLGEVLEAAAPDPLAALLAERRVRLVAALADVGDAMRGDPRSNPALGIEATAFRAWEGRPLGVLVTPWSMALVLLPGSSEDWSDLVPGAEEAIEFPSGRYAFVHDVWSAIGGLKACVLFEPMDGFEDQAEAVEAARAVLTALFVPAGVEAAAAPATRRAFLKGTADN